MKSRLFTFIFLMLAVMSVDARRSLFTNDDANKSKNMSAYRDSKEDKKKKDQEKVDKDRKKRDSDRKKQEKKDQEKRKKDQEKKESDRKKQERKYKIKVERQKVRKKASEPKPKKPKLTKPAAKMIADAHDAKALMHEANAQATQHTIDNHTARIKNHRKAQRNAAADLTQEASESHLLNVRYAETQDAREAAEQASCEAHGTCDTAQVQDMLDVIKQNRADLTQHNKNHEEAKGKARAHHVKAGTMDQYDAKKLRDHAQAIALGKKDYKGDHRLSNTHTDIKDHLNTMGHYDKKEAQKTLNRAQTAMDKARDDHKKRMEKDRKEREKKVKKINASSYGSKW